MAAIATGATRFDMGRVVSRTFGSIGRNWLVFGVLALLLAGIPQLVAGALQMQMFQGVVSLQNPTTADTQRVIGLGGFMAVTGLVNFICVFVLQAALVHGVVADLNGNKASFGDCLSTGLRYFMPVLAISILMAIALVFGLILLIVPGVLMALAWCVAVPAEVVERAGVFGAFGRSADLTRNHRGAILALSIAYFVVFWAISMTALGLTGGFQSMLTGRFFNWGTVSLNALVRAVEMLVSSAGISAIYYELRSTKEGIGPEALASVFD